MRPLRAHRPGDSHGNHWVPRLRQRRRIGKRRLLPHRPRGEPPGRIAALAAIQGDYTLVFKQLRLDGGALALIGDALAEMGHRQHLAAS
jgi:hypothetical protein